ncbi:glycoside hydrolase family 20 zincin-like fold domain-containing protein [Paracidobacterium acidisoli]|nr:glycoside hydrolase family 20 zincin-like fold domain-containing protein [Paracidobacterium acidisoli]
MRAYAAESLRPPLIPQPREFEPRSDISLASGASILVPGRDADDRFAAADLAQTLRERGIRISERAAAAHIYLLRDTQIAAKRLLHEEDLSLGTAAQPEGYVVLTAHHTVYIIGHTAEGVFYGAQTLKQLIAQGSGGDPVVKGCRIRDWPAMRYRGVDDDLSRGPIPTLDFQKQQIRTFAAYKINVYSPYFENTMQYASNPLPGLPGGSISAADARALVAYARPYHITIIPEQEAFGHLHHVLTWQQYAALGEMPAGSVLAPGQPGSLELITQWFSELASIYPAPFLHIGADETFQLGQGQTSSEVKQRGLGAVYIDFLTQIHQALAPLHRRLLFWGDIAMNDPALVPKLPHDMIAVAWEYNPQPKGFHRWLDPYTKAGLETWVAPGVNNWNRLWPNYDDGLRNIQGFIADGQKAGSTGALNTVWNDDGEGLFLEDWYGILFGAAASWQPGITDITRFQQDYGAVFHGDTTGKIDEAQRALIAAHDLLRQAGLEDARDAWFWLDPWDNNGSGNADTNGSGHSNGSGEGQRVAAKIRPVSAQLRLDAERALTLVAQARAASPSLREQDALDAIDLGARRIDFLAFKFQTADQIAAGYRAVYNEQHDPEGRKHISRDLNDLAGNNGLCEDLRDGFSYLRLRYSDLWLKENRPYWLENVTARYDQAIQLWMRRGQMIAAAHQQWSQQHTLPTPEEIGIPSEPNGNGSPKESTY